MDPDFPALRLDRAVEHLQQLDLEVDAFLERRPYRAREDRHPQRGYYIWRLEETETLSERAALHLSSVFGDLIHNLRAALDNLFWELLGKPETSALNFPTFTEPSDHNKFIKNYAGLKLPDGVFNILEAIQPYKAGELADENVRWPLRYINLLSNSDKHRAPQAVAAINQGATYDIPGAGLDIDAYDWQPNYGPLKPGAEIARLTMPVGDEPDVDVGRGCSRLGVFGFLATLLGSLRL